jgi:hypothetical protein
VTCEPAGSSFALSVLGAHRERWDLVSPAAPALCVAWGDLPHSAVYSEPTVASAGSIFFTS